jgi:hypothetical protein
MVLVDYIGIFFLHLQSQVIKLTSCLPMVGAQGLVTIHVNILSMYNHIQGRTFFLPLLALSRVCFLNSF